MCSKNQFKPIFLPNFKTGDQAPVAPALGNVAQVLNPPAPAQDAAQNVAQQNDQQNDAQNAVQNAAPSTAPNAAQNVAPQVNLWRSLVILLALGDGSAVSWGYEFVSRLFPCHVSGSVLVRVERCLYSPCAC